MVDEGLRVKGIVVRFFRGRGFGFIKPNDGGKELFLHREELITDDKREPCVKIGTEVEYTRSDKGGKLCATKVTLGDGERIPEFKPLYPDRKINHEETWTGTIKFFNFLKGFGFIKPDEMITWNGKSEDEGLFFDRDGIITANWVKGKYLNLEVGKRVLFKVFSNSKCLGAVDVLNEDASPFE